MSISREELHEFVRFAGEILDNGGAESLGEIVSRWEAARERQESVSAIRESVAEYDAGQAVPVDQAFSEVRRQLGAKP
ncbi:MAG: hypothetical protein KY476_02950 [Planctomycetes bacterium]|nr:hypothetical protein [Planctomycetota bacterium]